MWLLLAAILNDVYIYDNILLKKQKWKIGMFGLICIWII